MTIVEQLSEAQAKIAVYEAEKVARAESDAKMAEGSKAMLAQNESLKKQVADGIAERTALVAQHAEAMKAEQDAHKATSDELEKAKRALANPAFADAAIVGSSVKDNADAGVGAEADKNEPSTKEEALAQYKEIVGARERAAFRDKYAKILGLK